MVSHSGICVRQHYSMQSLSIQLVNKPVLWCIGQLTSAAAPYWIIWVMYVEQSGGMKDETFNCNKRENYRFKYVKSWHLCSDDSIQEFHFLPMELITDMFLSLPHVMNLSLQPLTINSTIMISSSLFIMTPPQRPPLTSQGLRRVNWLLAERWRVVGFTCCRSDADSHSHSGAAGRGREEGGGAAGLITQHSKIFISDWIF